MDGEDEKKDGLFADERRYKRRASSSRKEGT